MNVSADEAGKVYQGLDHYRFTFREGLAVEFGNNVFGSGSSKIVSDC